MTSVWNSLVVFPALLLALWSPTSACAWGQAGHRFITQAAIQELPAPLKTYFQSCQAQLVTQAAVEPAGTHFINIDYYPEFQAHTFPRNLSDLLAKYGTTVVNQNGTAPWTAVSYYTSLRSQFAAARTAADWSALLLNTAAPLAHYLEDLHNPMHLALNYDGQLTGQSGLHSRYESTLIQQRLSAGLQLATNVTDCTYIASLQDAIFDDIDLIYPNNATILAADLAAYAAAGDRFSANYYQHLWDCGCSGFTPAVMQQAAAMVASAWYSAWREAGFPQPYGVTPSTLFTLQFTNTSRTAGRICIFGDAGQKLELQTTTDCQNWTPVSTVTNLNGRLEIPLPSPTDARRFYRALLAH